MSMVWIFVNFRLFSMIYLRTRAVWGKYEGFCRGISSGHDRRGLRSIRALYLAWRALKVFFRWEWIRRFPGRPYFIFIRTILCVFCTSVDQTADNFRTLCAGNTGDRHRRQQQQCREHATTSWLQFHTTCCIAHSWLHWTLVWCVSGSPWLVDPLTHYSGIRHRG